MSAAAWRTLLWPLVALAAVAAIAPNVAFFRTIDRNADIWFIFQDAQVIAEGGNPYARIRDGDMRVNQKYPTYFPLFYLVAAATQALGLTIYAEWLAFWRVVFALFDVAITLLLLVVPWRRGLPLLGVFGALFWCWNRWTLFEVLIAQLDFIPIFLLLLSLVVLERRPKLALLLFGVSLAVKQIAIFLVPVFLAHVWRTTPPASRTREVARALGLIAAVPVVVSLPFLLADAEAYLRSIAFSATRLPRSHFGADSVDAVFGFVGLPAKLPMLGLMTVVYVCSLRGLLETSMAALLVLSVFVDFNSVLYTHYPCWVVPLLVLAACDHAAARASGEASIGPAPARP